MKKLVAGILLFVLLVPLVIISPTQAQSDNPVTQEASEDCNPEAVREWLLATQGWINAFNDIWADEIIYLDSSRAADLAKLLDRISKLERPACADAAMLALYELDVTNMNWFLAEDELDKPEIYKRSEQFREKRDQAFLDLATQVGITATELEEVRPEGWNKD